MHYRIAEIKPGNKVVADIFRKETSGGWRYSLTFRETAANLIREPGPSTFEYLSLNDARNASGYNLAEIIYTSPRFESQETPKPDPSSRIDEILLKLNAKIQEAARAEVAASEGPKRIHHHYRVELEALRADIRELKKDKES